MKVYAVRNSDGQWFRAKGYGGYGPSWVDSIEAAKLYSKVGQARSRVTYFARAFPDFGVPDLVEFDVVEIRVVTEEVERAKKAIARLDRRDAEYERRRAAWREAQSNWRHRKVPWPN